MPKTSKTTKLETPCPFCNKRYSTSHMYKHVKQEHPGMTYSTKSAAVTGATSTSTPEQIRDNRLRSLKQEFLDDKITATEHEKSKREIMDQYEIDVGGTSTAKLDIGKARTDIKYVQDYLIKYTAFDSLMKRIANGEHTTCFLELFTGQLQIQETCTGFKIQFVDQNKLVSENTDIDGLVKLYRLIIDAMFIWIAESMRQATDTLNDELHVELACELIQKYQNTLCGLGKALNLVESHRLAGIRSVFEHLHAPIILPH